MRKVAVLIPALNPPETLVQYVQLLVQEGFEDIIVVNDGSNEKSEKIFEILKKKKEVHYLKHNINLGKGRAIKTGFQFFEEHYLHRNDILGIITVDSDGQHLASDVSKIADEIEKEEKPVLVLGRRDFDLDFVPFKSKMGNKVTSIVFGILNNRYIHDTQTGLRGISKELIKEYLELDGERFEYEINMLIYAVHQKHNIREVEIQTVYIDGNSETHFNPWKDSLKIYRIILLRFFKYVFSSLGSSILDLGIFQILLLILGGISDSIKIFISTLIARIASSLLNFTINKKIVFKNDDDSKKQLIQYYILCIIQMIFSAILVIFLDKIMNIAPLVEKAFVDTVLFFVSYRIQQDLIFNKK